MSLKNSGPLLVSEKIGSFEHIPEDYRAKLGLHIEEQENPLDIGIDLLTAQLIGSEVLQTRTNERKKKNVSLIGNIATRLVAQEFIPRSGQVGSLTRQLVPEGSLLLTDYLTDRARQHNLGNGLMDQEVLEAPNLFPQAKYSRSHPSVTPTDFAANLQEQETALTLQGQATPPSPLTSGQISITDENLSIYLHRLTSRLIDVSSLPAMIVNTRTNQFKQVETITRILELDTTIPSSPTVFLDVNFTKLGDGTAVEERIVVPDLFSHLSSSTEIADLIPVEFKSLVPIRVHEQVVTGFVIDPPVLNPGDLLREETQVTEFTKRVRTRGTGSITYPKVLTNSEFTEKFGGGILNDIWTLNNAIMVPDSGLLVTESIVKTIDFANNIFLKETKQLSVAAWPTITSLLWDEEMQIFRQKDDQVVAAGTIPTFASNYNENVEAIDFQKSRRTRITRTPNAINFASALITYEWRPFQFPGTFDYISFIGFQHGAGYRRASAQLCRHTIRTWWLSRNPGPPTIGATGSGADIIIDDIITDTVTLPIFSPNNSTLFDRYPNVLHDTFATFTGLSFTATTPSFTQYVNGNISGTAVNDSVSLYAPGNNYHVNDNLTITSGGFTVTVRVVTLQTVGGGVLGFIQTSAGSFPNPSAPSPDQYGPIASTGGAGTGAQFYVTAYTGNTYTPGTAWIGSERAVSAKVTRTDIPFLWKIQLISIVMR